MKKTLVQGVGIFCLIAMLFSFVMLPGFAEDSATNTETPVRDVVLVLDCSGSMTRTDRNRLCATACKLLIDQMPLQNARIAIIAYGYSSGGGYQLRNYSVNNPSELNLINVVTPLTETESVKGIDTLKGTIDEVTQKNGKVTPTGTALLSAIDLLENSGATEENACIVLISDGECMSRVAFSFDEANAETAREAAKTHGWPIFALQMNDQTQFDENDDRSVLMRKLACESGSVAYGEKNQDYCYYNLTSFSQGNLDVSIALSNIFAWVVNSFPPPKPETYKLPADITYEVPNLTSEFNITVMGSSLTNVSLVYPDGSSRDISSNITTDKYILSSIVPGSYYNIKLFCPKEGMYKLHVDGKSNDVAVSLDISTTDMGLKLTSDPVFSTEPLNKNKTLNFKTIFCYGNGDREIEILQNRFYEEKQPELLFIGTGGTKSVKMNGNADGGYSASVAVSELSNYGSAFDVRVRLDDKMFSSGCKYSNTLHFKTENLNSKIINPAFPGLSADINSTFEKVDLSKYVENPDKDRQDVVLECTSDRNVQFEYTCENDYLEIGSGLKPGTYEMQLKVKDGDMTEFLVLNPFTLTVTESEFFYDEIDTVEVWLDAYSCQDAGAEQIVLNLRDYYYDPDGLEPKFSDITFEGKDTFYSCKQDGAILTFDPIEKGEGTVQFTVSDQMTEKTVQFGVEVVSGKAVWWEHNWIWFLLAAIVLVLTVIVLLVLSATTRVKGNWSIELTDDNGGRIYVDQIDIASNTTVGNKAKKVKLLDLIEEVSLFAQKDGMPVNYSGYEGINEIILKGVTFGNGFTVTKIPTGVKAEANGLEIKGQKRIKLETLRLEFKGDPNFGSSRMVLSMRPR